MAGHGSPSRGSRTCCSPTGRTSTSSPSSSSPTETETTRTATGTGLSSGTPRTAGRRLADFFLGDFLGCRYARDPDVLTQRFHDATAEWINSDDVPDPATRTRYAVALLAEINSARPQVSVREFAREHLAADDRDPYRRAMADAGVPAAAFPKDLALVNNRSTVQMNFESRTYLVTTRDAIAEGIVQVDEDSDPHGTAAVHIRDRLTSVKGRGAPGRRTPPGTQRPASADDRP